VVHVAYSGFQARVHLRCLSCCSKVCSRHGMLCHGAAPAARTPAALLVALCSGQACIAAPHSTMHEPIALHMMASATCLACIPWKPVLPVHANGMQGPCQGSSLHDSLGVSDLIIYNPATSRRRVDRECAKPSYTHAACATPAQHSHVPPNNSATRPAPLAPPSGARSARGHDPAAARPARPSMRGRHHPGPTSHPAPPNTSRVALRRHPPGAPSS